MLQGKPVFYEWLKRKTSSQKSQPTKRKTARSRRRRPHAPYRDWSFSSRFPLTDRAERTPQVNVPSRDTKCLVLKNIKKKKRGGGGEAIWKPDLNMDTWSDAGQTELSRQKTMSAFQTKYSPVTRLFITTHGSKLHQIMTLWTFKQKGDNNGELFNNSALPSIKFSC